jgi:HlyD family secretion protein
MMKFAVLIGSVAVAGAAVAGMAPREHALFPFGAGDAQRQYLGYVEGETTLVAPPTAGRLVARPLRRGDRVSKGETLFAIDTAQAEAEVARAMAQLAESRARHNNLLTGKRSEEQDVIRAQRREVEASLAMAEAEFKRQGDLLQRNFTSRQAYDQAESQVLQLRARLAALTAKERAGDLGARSAEIDAAAALVDQSKASLARAQHRLAQLAPVAPNDALIENTFYNVGEWVAAGSPVMSLLPDYHVKLRFFVPEEDMAKAQPGEHVRFRCDRCPSSLTAKITYRSPRAEYAPPVIYSQAARAQLVFMIEARPATGQQPLPPGLPVTVEALAPEAKP